MKWKFGRKAQRKMNRLVRNTNMSLYKDPLWRGRFFLQQSRVDYYVDDDYTCVWFHLLLHDRKTGLTKTIRMDNYDLNGFGPWILFRTINDFIVDEVKVWEENPRPSIHTAIDWGMQYQQ